MPEFKEEQLSDHQQKFKCKIAYVKINLFMITKETSNIHVKRNRKDGTLGALPGGE